MISYYTNIACICFWKQEHLQEPTKDFRNFLIAEI